MNENPIDGSEVFFDLINKITFSILILVVASVTFIAFKLNPFLEALSISGIAWSTAYSAFSLKGETKTSKRISGLIGMLFFYCLGLYTFIAAAGT